MNLLGESSQLPVHIPAPMESSGTDRPCLALAAPMGRGEGHLVSPQWGRGAASLVGPQPTSLGGWLQGIRKGSNCGITLITQLPQAGKGGT